MKNVSLKMIKAGLFTLTSLSSALGAINANAACVTNISTNKATITFNKGVLASMAGDPTKRIPAGSVISPVPSDSDTGTGAWASYGNRFIYLNTVIEERTGASPLPSTWTYATLNDATPITTAASPSGDTTTLAWNFPVVCTTSASPNYTTTFKTGNVASTYNGTSGAIGIAGVIKVRSSFQNPTLSLRFGKLNLTKDSAGKWELRDNLNGGSVFKLTEVYTATTGTTPKTLTLKANVRFANAVDSWSAPTVATADWGQCFRGVPTPTNALASVCTSPTGGTGTWWITAGTSSSSNALMMGPGTATGLTATGTGVLDTTVTPNVYKNSSGVTPSIGSEAQAIVGKIELQYQY